MGPHVGGQFTAFREGFPARLALIRLLPRVGTNVGGLLTCVGPDVGGQISFMWSLVVTSRMITRMDLSLSSTWVGLIQLFLVFRFPFPLHGL